MKVAIQQRGKNYLRQINQKLKSPKNTKLFAQQYIIR